jgi:predicted  nucleic acid-binding Zn-ribbon protein
MKEELAALRKLQELDTVTMEVKRSLQEKPEILKKNKADVAKSEKAKDVLVDEIKKLHVECDLREVDVKAGQEEIAKLNILLNAAKSNEEYRILKRKIEDIKRKNSSLEDTILGLFMEIEEKEKEVKEQNKRIAEEKKKLQEVTARVKGEIEDLEAELARLKGERAGAAKRIERDHLARYERVIETRGDKAIVPVIDQVCQGCFMRVTPNQINMLMRDRDLVCCKTCARILYLEE